MAAFLWVGAGIGALMGVLHSVLMFRQKRAGVGSGFGMALYFSVWTLALWTLFGPYLLFFYLLGGAAMLGAKLFSKGAS